MQRLKDDRGAMAVTVGLLMILVFAVGAAAVDVGAMWSDRRQLQNGADAGALAVAENCATSGCGDYSADVDSFADANKRDGIAEGTVVNLDESLGYVTVSAAADTDHWFAPLFGVKSTRLGAEATATWGASSSGLSSLPLAFSLCEIVQLTGAAGSGFEFDATSKTYRLVNPPTQMSTIYLAHPGNPSAKESPCNPQPSGAVVPGGFSWIDSTVDQCSASTAIDQWVGSDPGNPGPASCTEEYLSSLLDKTVTLPVFGETTGTGSGAKYKIYGYVGFQVKGLLLQSPGGPKKVGDTSGCNSGNGQCVKGYFTHVTDGTGDTSPTAPDLGASTIRLTLGATTP